MIYVEEISFEWLIFLFIKKLLDCINIITHINYSWEFELLPAGPASFDLRRGGCWSPDLKKMRGRCGLDEFYAGRVNLNHGYPPTRKIKKIKKIFSKIWFFL